MLNLPQGIQKKREIQIDVILMHTECLDLIEAVVDDGECGSALNEGKARKRCSENPYPPFQLIEKRMHPSLL